MNREDIKKVGLIQGGLGVEREVSLMSSQSVAKAFDELGILYEVIEADKNLSKNLSKLKPDCVFLAVHGKYAEDGTLQGICEYLTIPYTGSGVLGSALCMDKCFFKDYIFQYGIPTPDYQNLNLENHSLQEITSKDLHFLKWEKLSSPDSKKEPLYRSGLKSLDLKARLPREKGREATKKSYPLDIAFLNKEAIRSHLSFPLVIKPSREGSSLGVSICKNKEEGELALKKALQYDKKILIESYIEGTELAVSFLDGQVLTPVEIVSGGDFYDYKSKYQSKETQYILPPRLDEKVIETCKILVQKAIRILPIGNYGRVDFIVKNNTVPLITEVNTLPGLTTHSLLPKSAQKDGINFNTLILKILRGAVLDYRF